MKIYSGPLSMFGAKVEIAAGEKGSACETDIRISGRYAADSSPAAGGAVLPHYGADPGGSGISRGRDGGVSGLDRATSGEVHDGALGVAKSSAWAGSPGVAAASTNASLPTMTLRSASNRQRPAGLSPGQRVVEIRFPIAGQGVKIAPVVKRNIAGRGSGSKMGVRRPDCNNVGGILGCRMTAEDMRMEFIV